MTTLKVTRTKVRSSVAVDDTDDDNDCHAREGTEPMSLVNVYSYQSDGRLVVEW